MNSHDPKGYYRALGFLGDVKLIKPEEIARAYLERTVYNPHAPDRAKLDTALHVLTDEGRRAKYDKSFRTPSELRDLEISGEGLFTRIANAAKRAGSRFSEAVEGFYTRAHEILKGASNKEASVLAAEIPLLTDSSFVEAAKAAAKPLVGETVKEAEVVLKKGGGVRGAVVGAASVAAIGGLGMLNYQNTLSNEARKSWQTRIATAQPSQIAI